MSGRTITIGDIHGCVAALRTLLGALELRPEDTLIPLGDYIDRGPDSREVIELMLELPERCQLVPLIGNHEVMLLSALDDNINASMWLFSGGRETLDSYGGSLDKIPSSHLDFIRSCRTYFETASHFFVHAGYDPQVALPGQSQDALFWRHILADVPPPHCSGKIAVVGHTPQTSGNLRDLGHLIMLDTFCFGTGWLTALDVDSGRVWQADKHGTLR